MKQILQNVVNFEKPKVVLTRCNTEKRKTCPATYGNRGIYCCYEV